METQFLISWLAILISLISVLYARHTVKEAKRSNEIAIHNECLKIFKGILQLRGELIGRGVEIKDEDLIKYYGHVQLSEFYYPKDIYKQIEDYYNTTWKIVSYYGTWKMTEDKDKEQLRDKTYTYLKESRQMIEKLEPQMKKYLSLIKT